MKMTNYEQIPYVIILEILNFSYIYPFSHAYTPYYEEDKRFAREKKSKHNRKSSWDKLKYKLFPSLANGDSHKNSKKELLSRKIKYLFGYFKRDVYRKVYLVFSNWTCYGRDLFETPQRAFSLEILSYEGIKKNGAFPQHLKKLNISNLKGTDFFSNIPRNVRSIKWTNRFNENEKEMLKEVRQFPKQLRELKLCVCGVVNANVVENNNYRELFPKLKSLNLIGFHIFPKDFVSKIPKSIVKLKIMAFKRSVLDEGFNSLSNLKNLALEKVFIYNSSAKRSNFPSVVRSICLEGYNEKEIESLFIFNPRYKQLREIEFEKCDFGDEFLKNLKVLEGVRKLSLKRMKTITGKFLQSISDCITNVGLCNVNVNFENFRYMEERENLKTFILKNYRKKIDKKLLSHFKHVDLFYGEHLINQSFIEVFSSLSGASVIQLNNRLKSSKGRVRSNMMKRCVMYHFSRELNTLEIEVFGVKENEKDVFTNIVNEITDFQSIYPKIHVKLLS